MAYQAWPAHKRGRRGEAIIYREDSIAPSLGHLRPNPVNKTAKSRPGHVVIQLDKHHSAKPLPFTTRTQFVQHAEVVAEVDLSLPIGVFNLTVARMGRRTRICGRPTRGWWRTFGSAARSLWPHRGCRAFVEPGFRRTRRTARGLKPSGARRLR